MGTKDITPKEMAHELIDHYNSLLMDEIYDEFSRKYAVKLCVHCTVRKMIEWCDVESQPYLEQVEQELFNI
jgi:hypothetical protein